ncbi:nuclear transport factor 2 family protein [Deinococcus radiopugnans]|uniref:Ketosteroid isomerase-like protein n=1 Tax=Deinococcus radiopugnans ATCC 19172 TaxID=585398 RepID=A0ABR6NWP5_9DEIO|nr:nuclear transport factor 2 family protein [Deinococcus radiopugnans]MBB6017321.1 ketosteroid isomerase-like protein [Deinococcus radiopugnans ATCC 19172]
MLPLNDTSQADLDAVLLLDDRWNAAYHRRSPQEMAEVLADDWLAFFPDGQVVFKRDALDGMARNPPSTLVFERHASRVFGDTAITRGTLYADGERIQSFLRVYARRTDEWHAVSVQVVP